MYGAFRPLIHAGGNDTQVQIASCSLNGPRLLLHFNRHSQCVRCWRAQPSRIEWYLVSSDACAHRLWLSSSRECEDDDPREFDVSQRKLPLVNSLHKKIQIHDAQGHADACREILPESLDVFTNLNVMGLQHRALDSPSSLQCSRGSTFWRCGTHQLIHARTA